MKSSQNRDVWSFATEKFRELLISRGPELSNGGFRLKIRNRGERVRPLLYDCNICVQGNFANVAIFAKIAIFSCTRIFPVLH